LIASRFEGSAKNPTLPDDGEKRTDRHLWMIRYRNSDSALSGLELHHHMAAAPADFKKPVLLKNPADLST
jgi:hypothetical protein